MRESSCRALEVFERAAVANGILYADLIRDLPVPPEVLRNRSEWIDWDVFIEINERFERATSEEAVKRAAAAVQSLDVAKPLARVAGLAVDVRHVYRFAVTWLLPMVHRNIQVQLTRSSARELRVEIAIPLHRRGSCAWFRLVWGGLEALPTLLGLPPARVAAELTPHLGIFHVSLPTQRRKAIASLRAFFGGRALQELDRQAAELRVMDRERMHVDQALRERERLLSNLLANLSGVVYRCRAHDFRFEFASGSCLELTGYAAEELLARELALPMLVHPEDVESLRDKLRTSLEQRRPCSSEYRLYTQAGQTHWVMDVSQGLYDAQGRATGIEGFMTDVTAQKRMEQQLNHALRVEGIGRLAGGIAHDFNNLLSVMLGAVELSDMVLAKDSPAREYTEQVRMAAERAAALTGQLLAFARKQKIEPRFVDLNALVLGMDQLMRRTLGEDVELACVLAPDLWSVEIDPGQFEQVLLNLSINARDAMPEGGTLTIETAQIVLEQSSASLPGLEPGPYVVLSVRDTGTGMTSDVQRRAFEPFFTTKGQGKGTGLGLASSHGIVRQARGHIFLFSELGQGTEIRIYLPRAFGAPVVVESTLAVVPEGGRETLLIVEDHDLLRDMVVRTMEAQGYFVLRASSGIEALELAAQFEDRLDLLITDVVMPQMSGLVLAARLLETRPSLSVLYVSGYSEQNAVREHGDSSLAAFLAKPFTPSALAQAVREVLDRAKLSADPSRERSLRLPH
jgi:two-component system, cell cycle sensor histidine kinase and response regulator CckA